MRTATIVVQWFHVLFAIAWFGSVIGVNVVMMPHVMKLQVPSMRQFLRAFSESKLIEIFAGLTILLGLIRGTFLGQIRSSQALFGTAYGRTWFVGLLAALFAAAFPKVVVEKRAKAMLRNDALWVPGPSGAASSELMQALGGMKKVAPIGMLGLLVAFTCMILMRFGL